VAIEILLRVTRDAGDRLHGSATVADGSEVHEFSGMLELMRVFDVVIPSDRHDPSPPRPPRARAAGN
jgi:hypothetical protein